MTYVTKLHICTKNDQLLLEMWGIMDGLKRRYRQNSDIC